MTSRGTRYGLPGPPSVRTVVGTGRRRVTPCPLSDTQLSTRRRFTEGTRTYLVPGYDDTSSVAGPRREALEIESTQSLPSANN